MRSILFPLLLSACGPAPENLAPVEEAAPQEEHAPNGPDVAPPPGGKAGATPPGLAALVAGGPTVTLDLTLEGASDATVDFVVEGPDGGRILAQERVQGPVATLSVPATAGDPLWLSACSDLDADGPDPDDLRATPREPITLDGTPKRATLTFVAGGPPPDFGPFVRMEGQTAPPPTRP
jgi:hypothetical protein